MVNFGHFPDSARPGHFYRSAQARWFCAIKIGCSKRSGRDKDVSFYRVPVIIRNEGELTEELTTERRRKWISAITRDDITEKKMENDRVCSSHFVSGKPASNGQI